MIQIFCSSCTSLVPNYFYFCSKFHILCRNCCQINENHQINLCSTCDSVVILYIINHENETNFDEDLILKNAYSSGPVVFLNNIALSQQLINNSKGGCENRRPSYVRWARCVTCYKCLSCNRIREHYNHDHRNLLICPIPTKATISLIVNYENIGVSQLKNLQMFSATHQSNEMNNEKMFSIMATKVPFLIPSFHDFYYVILIWLFSQFHACDAIYTIQAVDVKKKFPIVSFTGQPMDSDFMDNLVKGVSTIEEFGQYLVMKKSLFNHSNKCLPEAIINVTIDKL